MYIHTNTDASDEVQLYKAILVAVFKKISPF